MSWLNNTISHLAPSWALERQKAKLAFDTIKGYDAAKKSRTHKANKESRGANQAVFAAGKSLREQARWLDENHDLSIGILDNMAKRVIGAQGIIVEPQPRGHDGEILPKLAKDLQRRFGNWSLKPDVTGRFTRPELERLVLRTALRDGEVFGKHVKGKISKLKHPNDQGTHYSIEAVEPDFVPFELNEPSKGIRQGIQFNAWGQVTYIHVLLDHPADKQGFRHKTKAQPAENMMHLGMFKRLHQARGVSLFHGVMTRLSDIKEYEESERVAARISAALAFVIKRGDPNMYTPPTGDDKDTSSVNFAPGMTTELKPGEEIDTLESKRPNVMLVDFRNGQIKAVAAGTMGHYSAIANDYSGTYSSQRQELVEQDESNLILQQWFCAGWTRKTYRNWLQMELLNKVDPLTLPPELDINSLYDAMYYGPTMPWINPVHESKGWESKIKGNAASESDWIRALGRDPQEVRRQRKLEIEANRKDGMSTHNDPAIPEPNKQPPENGANNE